MARSVKNERVGKERPQGQVTAAVYCRVSTGAQAEDDKVSLGEQLADCEEYCRSQGYEVVARYSDVMSGATSRRPDFQRMLKDAQAKLFTKIVCWKVDRISRGLFPMARLLEVMEAAGIGLEAAREAVDAKYLGLFASVGKIELDNIRERTMSARLAYARQGVMPNRSMRYGYAADEQGRPIVNEAEREVLLEAAHRYAAGEQVPDICADFAARGIASRNASKIRHEAWSSGQLWNLLSDETYFTGQRTYGGEVVPFPPLFDEPLWRALQGRRRKNVALSPRATKNEYLCQHLLHCAECGMKFTSITNRTFSNRNVAGERVYHELKAPQRYYRCMGMQRYPRMYKCRPVGGLRVDLIDGLVWDLVVSALDEPDVLLAGSRARLAELEAQRGDDGEGGEPERQLAQLKWERMDYFRQRARGAIPDDATLDALLAEVDAKIAHWTERMESEARGRDILEQQKRTIREATAFLGGLKGELRETVKGKLATLPFERRRALVLTLVDRITLDGENALHIVGTLRASVAAPTGMATVEDDSARSRTTRAIAHSWELPFSLERVLATTAR